MIERAVDRARRSPIFREFLGFGSSTVVEQASQLLTQVVAAALLGPIQWGQWYLLKLIIQYGSFAHLGAMNGMNRQVPLEVGQGRPIEAEKLRRATLGTVAVTVVAVTLIGAIVALAFSESAIRNALLLTLAFLVARQLYGYALMSLKSHIAFPSISQMQFGLAAVLPLFSIPLIFAWGLEGFIAGQTLAYLALLLAVACTDRRVYQLRFDAIRSMRAIRIGFPIMLAGALFVLFTTVDRWIIALVEGPEALGWYSLAIMALSGASLLPYVVAQQFYPRMSRSWGRSSDWGTLNLLAMRQGRFAFLATLPFILAGWLTAHPFVARFLPEYLPGVPSLLIILAGPLVFSLAQGYGNVLNVTNHQTRYLSITAIAVVVNLGLGTLLVQRFGITGVAASTSLSYGLFSVALVVTARKLIREMRATE